MRMKSISLTTLLAAGAAAVAITAAPIAAAAPTGAADPGAVQTACSVGPGSECITPGNAQINDSPPPVSFDPYGGEEFAMVVLLQWPNLAPLRIAFYWIRIVPGDTQTHVPPAGISPCLPAGNGSGGSPAEAVRLWVGVRGGSRTL